MLSIIKTNKKCFFILVIVGIFIILFFVMQSNLRWKGINNQNSDRHAHFIPLSNFVAKNRNSFDYGLAGDTVHKKEVRFQSPRASTHNVVTELADILAFKLSMATKDEAKVKPVCRKSAEIANSCDDGKCLRTKFSINLRDRIDELVSPKELKMTKKMKKTFEGMAANVKGGVKFMILTAVSSNHFLEVQAMLQNIHTTVFPNFKNFSMVIYNIGLTAEERDKLVEFSKCQVVDFPFYEFPAFVSKRGCYSWKPLIIKAHLGQANIIVWADASIRFDSDPSYLTSLLKKARKRGVILGSSDVVSPFRTFRDMYHFFGDEPCMYLNMPQVQATIGLYASEFFVNRAVLEPWASCAVAESCMCSVKKPKKSCADSKKMATAWEDGQGPIVYGLCHRFDQSAISLILQKLYQGYFDWVTFHVNSFVNIKRNDRLAYFDLLAASTNMDRE